MDCVVKNCDVLDEPADALVYSINIMLNCTGGVSAGLVMRYGAQVQEELHALFSESEVRYGTQGKIYEHVCEGMPYRNVFHTMPCDGWYNTTPEIVEDILARCLHRCAEGNVTTIASSVLAAGFGDMDFDEFFRIVDRMAARDAFAAIGKLTVCIADASLFEQAIGLIHEESLRFE